MKRNTTIVQTITEVLEQVRIQKPLIDVITNRVTINDCANILLAAGASPIMSEDEREVYDIVSISQGVVLNLGILSQSVVSTMLSAANAAKEKGIPVIFDPVGAGASKLRDQLCKQILTQAKPDVIRGNFSEIKALSGKQIQSRGVDASGDDVVTEENITECGILVQELAKQYHCVVCASGAIDIIADSNHIYFCKNGNEMLCDVTGTGCMLSALTGATCAVGDALQGALAAVVLMGIAGEFAAESCKADGSGIGTFRIRMMDGIYQLKTPDILEKGAVYGG